AVGDRRTGPVVSCFGGLLASVTEIAAKRGSTASSKVSETREGGLLRIPLADGNVLTRYACADAATGSASPIRKTASARAAPTRSVIRAGASLHRRRGRSRRGRARARRAGARRSRA